MSSMRAGTKIAILMFCITFFTAESLWCEEYILAMPQEFLAATDEQGDVRFVSANDLEMMFKEKSHNIEDFYSNKKIEKYVVADYAWLLDMLYVVKEYIRKMGLQWESDNWDCDNYSMLLNSFTTLRMWRAGYINQRCALGWMIVDAKHDWAGIPGTMHALVFAYTSKGLVVIEPQNGKTVTFEKYPNNAYIKQVFLF